ncbi:DUF885 domain-containing protein [Marinicella rhabdoformis]|uniref:DUF885 domain-containing protein n=1 Tax=Marinicella rhabdoformis TaxID=2580566 RepID=UPI0012AEB288|nr:DUF885 domain-containing protein [Marinicella rhabdoformis]
MKKTTLILAMSLALSACQQDDKTTEETTEVQTNQTTSVPVQEQAVKVDFDALYQKSTATLFSARPVSASMYGLNEAEAGGAYSHRLDDYSPEAEAKLRQGMRELKSKMTASDEQSGQAEENRQVMMDINQYFAGDEAFDIGYIDVWMGLSAFVINQINGPLIDVPNTLANNHVINSSEDAADYLKRLTAMGTFVDHVIAKSQHDIAQGWLAPKVIIEKTIAGLESFIAPKPVDHPLMKHLTDSIKDIEGMTQAETDKITQATLNAVSNVVYPAYQKVITQQTALLDQAPTTAGIWAQPNGEAFYRSAVKVLGDTDLSPQEVHDVGLSEVERILAEMDAIFQSEGMTEGTVGERMTALNDDPRFLYEDSDAGRAQLLADLNGHIAEINQRMPEQFGTAPPYEVEVRKFPKSREASAPGGMYNSPSLDGSQPGIYWINLRDIKANPKFDLKTLTYHEANPGHHWQVALNLAQDSLPMLRRIAPYNAFVEGWALYSELVAFEMGMYENDPFGNLGRLKAELFRAVRLVVDTGLHYKKWTREEAIKYMAETTGTVESDVVAEIERYMIWPGQALGYKMGMINMVKLRQKAKDALGEQFDIKAFHDLILLGGAVPMSVLDKKVDAWIQSQQSK